MSLKKGLRTCRDIAKKYFLSFWRVGYDIWTTLREIYGQNRQKSLKKEGVFSMLYLFRRKFHWKIVKNTLFTNRIFCSIIQKLSAAPIPQPRTTVFIALRSINLMISCALGVDSRLCFSFFGDIVQERQSTHQMRQFKFKRLFCLTNRTVCVKIFLANAKLIKGELL